MVCVTRTAQLARTRCEAAQSLAGLLVRSQGQDGVMVLAVRIVLVDDHRSVRSSVPAEPDLDQYEPTCWAADPRPT